MGEWKFDWILQVINMGFIPLEDTEDIRQGFIPLEDADEKSPVAPKRSYIGFMPLEDTPAASERSYMGQVGTGILQGVVGIPEIYARASRANKWFYDSKERPSGIDVRKVYSPREVVQESILPSIRKPIPSDVEQYTKEFSINPQQQFEIVPAKKVIPTLIEDKVLEGIKWLQEYNPLLKSSGGAVEEGVSSFITSVGTRLPATIAGSIGGGVAGGIAGYATSGALLYGLAEYDRFIEQAKKERPDLSDNAIKKQAQKAFALEAGLELSSDMLDILLLKVGKPVIQTFKQSIKQSLKTPVKQIITAPFKMAAVEVPTEMGQEAGGAYLRKDIGLSAPEPLEAAKGVVAPTIISSILFAGLGVGVNARYKNSLIDALENPNTHIEKRLQAVYQIGDILKKSNPDIAVKWFDNAVETVARKEAINTGQDVSDFIQSAKTDDSGKREDTDDKSQGFIPLEDTPAASERSYIGFIPLEDTEETQTSIGEKQYRVVLEETPLKEIPDHWTTNQLDDAQIIKQRMEQSDGVPRKIIEIDAEAVKEKGGTPQGKSPYNTGADWIRTDVEVTPDAIKGVVGGEIKTRVMNILDSLTPSETSTGHAQQKTYIADLLGITPKEVEAAAVNIKETGSPKTDIERGLINIIAQGKYNRYQPEITGQPVKVKPSRITPSSYDENMLINSITAKQAGEMMRAGDKTVAEHFKEGIKQKTLTPEEAAHIVRTQELTELQNTPKEERRAVVENIAKIKSKIDKVLETPKPEEVSPEPAVSPIGERKPAPAPKRVSLTTYIRKFGGLNPNKLAKEGYAADIKAFASVKEGGGNLLSSKSKYGLEDFLIKAKEDGYIAENAVLSELSDLIRLDMRLKKEGKGKGVFSQFDEIVVDEQGLWKTEKERAEAEGLYAGKEGIFTGDLKLDEFHINGEKFTVKELPNNKLQIKDGAEYIVDKQNGWIPLPDEYKLKGFALTPQEIIKKKPAPQEVGLPMDLGKREMPAGMIRGRGQEKPLEILEHQKEIEAEKAQRKMFKEKTKPISGDVDVSIGEGKGEGIASERVGEIVNEIARTPAKITEPKVYKTAEDVITSFKNDELTLTNGKKYSELQETTSPKAWEKLFARWQENGKKVVTKGNEIILKDSKGNNITNLKTAVKPKSTTMPLHAGIPLNKETFTNFRDTVVKLFPKLERVLGLPSDLQAQSKKPFNIKILQDIITLPESLALKWGKRYPEIVSMYQHKRKRYADTSEWAFDISRFWDKVDKLGSKEDVERSIEVYKKSGNIENLSPEFISLTPKQKVIFGRLKTETEKIHKLYVNDARNKIIDYINITPTIKDEAVRKMYIQAVYTLNPKLVEHETIKGFVKKLKEISGKHRFYSPQVREGNYMVRVANKGGDTLFAISFDTETEAIQYKNKLQQGDYSEVYEWYKRAGKQVNSELASIMLDGRLDVDIDHSPLSKIPFEATEGLDLSGAMRLVEQMSEGKPEQTAKVYEEIVEKMLDLQLSKGWSKHKIHRENIDGYELDTKKVRKQLETYMIGYGYANAKGKDMQATAKDLGRFIQRKKDMPPEKLIKHVKSWLDYSFGSGEEQIAIKTAHGISIFALLSNLASSMVNMTQNYILGNTVLIENGMPLINPKTVVDVHTKNLTLKEKAALIKLMRSGYGQMIWQEMLGNNEDYSHTIKKITEDVLDIGEHVNIKNISKVLGDAVNIGMLPFKHVETFINRMPFFVHVYRTLTSKGISHNEAVNKAIELMNEAHFESQRFNRSKLQRGNIGRPLTALMTYNIHALKKLNRLWEQAGFDTKEKKKATAALVYLAASQTLLGGAAALPLIAMGTEGWKIFKWLYAKATDGRNLNADIRNLPKGVNDFIEGGILKLMGFGGLSSRLTFGFNVSDPTKNIIGLNYLRRANDAYKLWEEGQEDRAIIRLLPGGFRYAGEAYLGEKYGVTTKTGTPIYDEEGEKITPTPTETVLKIIGIDSNRIINVRQGAEIVRDMENERKKILVKFRTALIRARTDEEEDNVWDALDEYNNKIDKRYDKAESADDEDEMSRLEMLYISNDDLIRSVEGKERGIIKSEKGKAYFENLLQEGNTP